MINTSPINFLLQQIKSAELSNQKEVKLTITQARLLSITLSELLLTINQDYTALFHKLSNHQENQIITINMDGGDF